MKYPMASVMRQVMGYKGTSSMASNGISDTVGLVTSGISHGEREHINQMGYPTNMNEDRVGYPLRAVDPDSGSLTHILKDQIMYTDTKYNSTK
jgi:hypothetical protein